MLARRAAEGRGLDGAAQEFFPIAAAVAFQPWTLAAMSDFLFAQTPGERAPDSGEQVQYFQAVERSRPTTRRCTGRSSRC